MILLALMLLLPMPAAHSLAPATEPFGGRWPGVYDNVYEAALSSFAPLQYRDTFRQLRMRDIGDARPALEKALSADPHCLAVWVGLMQCEPEQWRATLAELSRTANDTPQTDELRFKQAVLLYYLCMDTGDSRSVDAAMVKEAEVLFRHSCVRSRNVLSGLFLADALQDFHNRTGDPTITPDTPNQILDQSIRMLAGQNVYAMYLQGKTSEWQSPSPSASLVVPDKRRELLAIVSAPRSWAGARYSSTGSTFNGVWKFTYAPYTAEQKRRMSYFAAWYNDLEDRIHSTPNR